MNQICRSVKVWCHWWCKHNFCRFLNANSYNAAAFQLQFEAVWNIVMMMMQLELENILKDSIRAQLCKWEWRILCVSGLAHIRISVEQDYITHQSIGVTGQVFQNCCIQNLHSNWSNFSHLMELSLGENVFFVDIPNKIPLIL